MKTTRPSRCGAALFAVLVVFGAPRAARAADLPRVGGTPVTLDVTETAVANWHFDNRNGARDDDAYGEWLNRLDTRLVWSRLTIGFRLDSAAYYLAPTPAYLASKDLDADGRATGRRAYWDAQLGSYRASLDQRYRQSIYPSKLWVSWATPETEVTVGDFYVQFGRGLVLSLRKLDELAVDTTLRGAKAEARGKSGDARFTATLVAGHANPVRVDEASGRRLVAPRDWYFAGMPAGDGSNVAGAAVGDTFRPDGILGARVEGGTSDVMVGAQASLVARGSLDDVVAYRDDLAGVTFPGALLGRANKFVETGSVSVSAPKLPGEGSAYVEVAGQKLDRAREPFGGAPDATRDVTGHAVYASFSIGGDPVSLLVEARHARRFWPLLANVDLRRAAEFAAVAYSAPPTTGPITQDTELGFFATCTTGGRARVDARLGEHVSAYASVGRYATWGERFGLCGADGEGLAAADRNDVLDPYAGLRVAYDASRSHLHAWGGARFDDAAVPFKGADGRTTTTYYREGYVRYDWLHTLSPTWAVQEQGFHRWRALNDTDAEPWLEGENYLALQWSAKVIASLGYEYSSRGGAWQNFVNVGGLVRLGPATSLRVFVGQQRGALRCVSGVCRQFPPFEGAKTELVVRF